MDALTDALTQSLSAPPPQPSRTLFGIITEYNSVRVMMSNVPNDPSVFPNQAVYRRVLRHLAVEIMAATNVREEDESDNESNSVGF